MSNCYLTAHHTRADGLTNVFKLHSVSDVILFLNFRGCESASNI